MTDSCIKIRVSTRGYDLGIVIDWSLGYGVGMRLQRRKVLLRVYEGVSLIIQVQTLTLPLLKPPFSSNAVFFFLQQYKILHAEQGKPQVGFIASHPPISIPPLSSPSKSTVECDVLCIGGFGCGFFASATGFRLGSCGGFRS